MTNKVIIHRIKRLVSSYTQSSNNLTNSAKTQTDEMMLLIYDTKRFAYDDMINNLNSLLNDIEQEVK